MRTLARAGAEDFATVLFGTGSGVPVAAALEQQLGGFITGLRQADAGRVIRRITICELDRHKYAALRRATANAAQRLSDEDLRIVVDEGDATLQRLRQLRSDSKELTLTNARWITLAWGLLVTLAAVGVYFAGMGSLLQVGATIIGFFAGPLLGMFLLGIFILRANSVGAILGAISGFVAVLLLRNHISFVWYPVAGCMPTLLFGFAFSLLGTKRRLEDVYPMTILGRQSRETHL